MLHDDQTQYHQGGSKPPHQGHRLTKQEHPKQCLSERERGSVGLCMYFCLIHGKNMFIAAVVNSPNIDKCHTLF